MFRILKLSGILILVSLAIKGQAQKYIQPFAGINFGSRMLQSDFSERKDSLDKADGIKVFPAFGVKFLFEKKSGKEFYFGFTYHEIGFLRERLDYQFQDTVHPDLGRLNDLSQAAQKNGFFTYKFKYLDIPIGLNYQVTGRENMHIYTGWFNIGLNAQILLKQQMNLFLEGFTIRGENRFKFDNTGYDASKFNLALQAGGRLDFAINKKTWATINALMNVHLLNSAENSYEKIRLWNLSAQLGLRYEIGDY
ncbi:MAG: hypothetical protein H6605_02750 [Flavobacteriales bacterium]|nr:hypothetical protein [Flavobacteriales bacterium]